MLKSCVGKLCCNADLSGLQSAGSDCYRLSCATVLLCNDALSKCQSVISYGEDIQSTLTGFTDINNMSPSAFMKLRDLVAESDDKLKELISIATETDDMALECANNSKEMVEAMNRGVDSLPDPVKEAVENEVDDDGEFEEEKKLIDDIDKDIEDVEICTKSFEEMDIFTAAHSGKDAFSGLFSKWELCRTIFEKIKDSSTSISNISEAIEVMGDKTSLCAFFSQIQAIMSESREIFRSISLSKLISQLAEAVNRLIKAIIRLVQTAIDTFQGFGEEFQAGKTIQNFLSNKWNSLTGNNDRETSALGTNDRRISSQMEYQKERTFSFFSTAEDEKKETFSEGSVEEFEVIDVSRGCPLTFCM